MFCFSERKLLSARKSWRVFTRKIKTKLYKLQISKALKKPKMKNRVKATTKPSFWPALTSFPCYHQRGRGGTSRVCKFISHGRSRLQKRIPHPVYIDQLFVNKEESSTTVSPHTNKTKIIDQQVCVESIKVKEKKKHTSGDEMWESLVLASPQMYGINERAEEFIVRFRAEMHKQERSATHF